jgi:hypothetical protein
LNLSEKLMLNLVIFYLNSLKDEISRYLIILVISKENLLFAFYVYVGFWASLILAKEVSAIFYRAVRKC